MPRATRFLDDRVVKGVASDAFVLRDNTQATNLCPRGSHFNGGGRSARKGFGKSHVEDVEGGLIVNTAQDKRPETTLIGDEGDVETGTQVKVSHGRRYVDRVRQILDHIRSTRSHHFRRSTRVRREQDTKQDLSSYSIDRDDLELGSIRRHHNPGGVRVTELASAPGDHGEYLVHLRTRKQSFDDLTHGVHAIQHPASISGVTNVRGNILCAINLHRREADVNGEFDSVATAPGEF